MLDKLRTAFDYYLHEPEKSHVIVRTYFLNRVHTIIDSIFFFLFDLPRRLIKWIGCL